MANIGTLAVQLSANPSAFTKGLETAKSGLSGFVKSVNSMTGNDLARGIKGGLVSVRDNLNNLLTDPMNYVAGIMKKVPYVGELLALPFEGIGAALGTYKEGADRLKSLARDAAQVGMSVSELRTIMIAAGPAGEGMARALFKLQQNLGSAAMGSKEARDNFAKLGLNGEQLSKMPLGEAFRALSERFIQIKNPALQAKLAFDLFGKSGKDALFALSKGPAGFDKAKGILQQFGLGASEKDLANIREAGEAQKQIQFFREGLTNQITIGIAPILAELNAMFGKTGVTLAGFSEHVITAAQYLAYGGAVAVETWKGLGLVWNTLKAGIFGLATAVIMAGQAMYEGFEWAVKGAAKAAAAMAKINPFFRAQMKAIGVSRDDMLALAEGGFGDTGIQAWLTERRGHLEGEARGAVRDMFEGVGAGPSAFQQVDRFFDNVRKRMADTKKAAGEANPFERWVQYFDRIKALKDEVASPLESFDKKMAEINELAKSGMLDWDTYYRAVSKTFTTLEGAVKLPEPKAPATILEGSKEAFSAIQAFQRESAQARNPQERIEAVLKEAKALQQKQVEQGAEIAEALKRVFVRS